jgi:anaerobic selenocysteine-containing dehydrogenase
VSGHCIDAFSAGVQTFRAYHCPMVISGNVDRPGGNLRMRTPKGFRSLDFVAVAAHAMTPTAEQADIVLALCRCPPALEGHLLPPRHAHDGRR